MKKLRTCDSSSFFTGVSKCQIDFGKILGAIIVNKGRKLPAELTADKLEELVHADGDERVYGIVRFVEYAPNGGEAQTATNGYGPEEFTGFSARKDTYTLNAFYPELHSSLTKNAHLSKGVYFFDENNVLYGLDDGTDLLAPFPMASIYSDATPHPTSSAKSTMSVTFAHEDAKKSAVGFDYLKLDFDPMNCTLGLTPVKLQKDGANGYKLYEAVGGYDVTPIYGPLLAEADKGVFAGAVSAISYETSTQTLTVTSTGGDVRLASPSTLFKAGIAGIEQV